MIFNFIIDIMENRVILLLLTLLKNRESQRPKGGNTHMRKYEVMFAVQPRIDEEAKKAVVDRFVNILSEGAEAVEVKDLGKKRLAYEIEDFTDAFYYVVELTSETDASTKEFDRLAKISDDIIRHMVVRLEK